MEDRMFFRDQAFLMIGRGNAKINHDAFIPCRIIQRNENGKVIIRYRKTKGRRIGEPIDKTVLEAELIYPFK